MAGGDASSTDRAPEQGGVLDANNPIKWNSRDPIPLFIIQVKKLIRGPHILSG